MNENIQSTATLSAENKTYYDKRLIQFAKPNLVHDQFGQKRPIPKNGGKTIEFRSFSSLPKALTPLTEGVTPDGENLTVEQISASVNQYGSYVTTTDMLNMTAIDNIVVETAEVLGDQAGRTLDTVVREYLNAGASVQYGDGSKHSRAQLTQEDTLTVKAVQRAVASLKKNNAKPFADGSFVAIIHPSVAHDLMRDPEWKDVAQYNPAEWYAGEIGRIAGVRFVETTEAKTFAPVQTLCGHEYLTIQMGDLGTRNIVVAEPIDESLVGKEIVIGGLNYTVESIFEDSLYTVEPLDESVMNAGKIYPAGGSSDGSMVYSTLILGRDAYGVTEVNGGGLEMIVKPLGSGGTGDPLNQRSTMGWKATKVAKILTEEYMVRVETMASL